MSRLDKLVEVINGERFLTVKHFAWLTKRSEQSVRFLMIKGNRVRKLKSVHIIGRALIPVAELTGFPFTLPGRKGKSIYHYTEEGKQVS